MMVPELQTRITALLPPSCAVRLTEVTVEQASVRLQLTATAPTAACPRCPVSSSSIHSRYQRYLTDLPWGTRAVHLQLTVRKFLCRNPTCTRRLFTERLPALVAAYARTTGPRVGALRAIGVALGGNAGVCCQCVRIDL
jgi:transposase